MIFIIKTFNNNIKVFPPNYSSKLPCHYFGKKKKNQICDVKKNLFICTILVVRGTLFGLEKIKMKREKLTSALFFVHFFFSNHIPICDLLKSNTGAADWEYWQLLYKKVTKLNNIPASPFSD